MALLARFRDWLRRRRHPKRSMLSPETERLFAVGAAMVPSLERKLMAGGSTLAAARGLRAVVPGFSGFYLMQNEGAPYLRVDGPDPRVLAFSTANDEPAAAEPNEGWD